MAKAAEVRQISEVQLIPRNPVNQDHTEQASAGQGNPEQESEPNDEPEKTTSITDPYHRVQDQGDEGFILPGKILLVAAQNETVDKLFQDAWRTYREYAASLGLPVPLIIRMHHKTLELTTASSKADARFDDGPRLPSTIDQEATFQYEMEELLRMFYISRRGQKHYRVYDKRL